MTVSAQSPQPANRSIVVTLRDEIMGLHLKPGDLISEAEVGKRLGASRTPVREAFAQLRDEGLVETFASRGTFVTRLSVPRLRAAQFLREAVEVAVVERLCAQGVPEGVRQALTENLDRQKAAVAEDDATGFQTLDSRFHALLAEATGLPRVGPVLLREKALLDRLRALTPSDATQRGRLVREHEALLQGVLGGWTVSALGQVRTHLRRVLPLLSDIADENPAYFEDDG